MRPNFLKGIRIVDLTWAGAGPFSTKVFSDFGAEVIKIEGNTRVDPVRLGSPFRDGIAGINRSGYFASRNTSKKSLGLDLKQEEARQIVRKLIADADIVSNNFGPGAMDRLGLGYDDVRQIKPDIIYLSMPMYGESGPMSAMLGVGMTISAVTGLMWLAGHPGGPPIGPGTHFPDHAANPYHAAFAVLAALRLRRRSGQGMKIDLAQVESTINVMGIPFTEFAATNVAPTRIGNASPRHAPHNLFRCKGDDDWCAIAVLNDSQWQALAGLIGRTDLAGDDGLRSADGRLARAGELEAAIAGWTKERTGIEVERLLQSAGVPAGLVANSQTLIEDDAQLKHRSYWQYVDHPELKNSIYSSPPYIIDGERVELARPPLIGEHTDQILSSHLGFDQSKIDALRASGVVAP